ncbi:MAG TPA: hypothetical protein VIY47_12725 [Ignavibacteriaceae bacterium]
MNINVVYAGVDTSNRKRVWGYLIEKAEPWYKSQPVHTFWGSLDGNIYFQEAKKNVEFLKKARKKEKKYPYKDLNLYKKVANEFSQQQVIKKLVGNE